MTVNRLHVKGLQVYRVFTQIGFFDCLFFGVSVNLRRTSSDSELLRSLQAPRREVCDGSPSFNADEGLSFGGRPSGAPAAPLALAMFNALAAAPPPEVWGPRGSLRLPTAAAAEPLGLSSSPSPHHGTSAPAAPSGALCRRATRQTWLNKKQFASR